MKLEFLSVYVDNDEEALYKLGLVGDSSYRPRLHTRDHVLVLSDMHIKFSNGTVTGGIITVDPEVPRFK